VVCPVVKELKITRSTMLDVGALAQNTVSNSIDIQGMK
jgi:hypothetical protein